MKKIVLTALTTLVLLLAVSGCVSSGGSSSGGGSTGDMPGWYLDPQSVYPDDKFMTAIGTGDTRRAAEQSAMAGLSQIFKSEISVDVSTAERYKDLVGPSGSMSESELMLAQSTNVQSNQTLLNVQFGEAAVDGEGRVHVIAYIDRMATGRIYQDLISKNSGFVQDYMGSYQSQSNPINKYAYISAASVIAQSNEMLLEQLRIISQAYYSMSQVPYDFRKVQQAKADTASKMTISIQISGDTGDRVASVVRQSLSSERFPTADPALMQIKGSVSMESIELNPKYKSVRWQLSLDFVGPDGKSLISYENQNKASGVTDEAARSFAYDDIGKAVEKDFIGSVRGYFDGLVLGN